MVEDMVHDCYLIILDFQFYHIYRDHNDTCTV